MQQAPASRSAKTTPPIRLASGSIFRTAQRPTFVQPNIPRHSRHAFTHAVEHVTRPLRETNGAPAHIELPLSGGVAVYRTKGEVTQPPTPELRALVGQARARPKEIKSAELLTDFDRPPLSSTGTYALMKRHSSGWQPVAYEESTRRMSSLLAKNPGRYRIVETKTGRVVAPVPAPR